jgi:hypothetical protein
MSIELPSSGKSAHEEGVAIPTEDIRAAAFAHRLVGLVASSEGRDPQVAELRTFAQEKLFPPQYVEALTQRGIVVDKIYTATTKRKVEITARLTKGSEERDITAHYRVGEPLEIRVGTPEAVSPHVYEMPESARFEDVAAKIREVSEAAF